MERMTHERANGIKTGYWSPATKETLVQRLAAYENTGLEPWEIGPAIEKAARTAQQLRRVQPPRMAEQSPRLDSMEPHGRRHWRSAPRRGCPG